MEYRTSAIAVTDLNAGSAHAQDGNRGGSPSIGRSHAEPCGHQWFAVIVGPVTKRVLTMLMARVVNVCVP